MATAPGVIPAKLLMRVNFMCHPARATGCPGISSNIVAGCVCQSVSGKKLTSELAGFADCPAQCVWADLLRMWTEQKAGRESSLPLCLTT